ncbi:hypothetical protein [Enterobacter hormaechei]|uniref:CHAT domain-containing protein n=3 Tax=Enterobacter hormaechei TaxID=158836 RepID=A0A9X7Q3E6_9ENTR|nr:hypothetical protein [Enterobacter hormaechei]KTK26826.1 hypothetical protein ASU64_24350 [Enterobacter hormaechei subsp. hoffmannii]PXB34095.1 hypothetical protein DL189_24385 [Enterobacter hormaechei]
MDVYKLIEVELKKSILSTSDYDASKLQELLESVYDYIYECKNADKIRISVSKLSQVFHSVGDNTTVVLLFILINKLHDLNGINTLKHSSLEIEPALDKISDYLQRDMILNHGQYHFFQHKTPSNPLGKHKLYVTISFMLHEFLRNTDKEDDDINLAMILLINMWELAHKVDRLHEFYIIFCSFLHKLHLRQKTQMVRDLAEASLLIGIKDDNLQYSFYVRMAVYSRQFNIIDSLLSAHLMMHGYNYKHRENELFISKSLLETFISLRNFKLYPFALKIKEAHDKLNITDEYDKHQFDMAMFNMKLIMADDGIFDLVDEHLKNNDVLKFDVASGLPWFVLLLNLKRYNAQLFNNYHNLTKSLSELESHKRLCSSPEIIDFKKAMSNTAQENKEAVQKGISNILKSRSYTDVNYELTMLQPIVLNLLKNSIKTKDFEGILIAHALSSGPLGFEINAEEATMDFTPLKIEVDIPSPTIFDDYMQHLSKIIERSQESVFLWTGCCDEFCYSVSLSKGVFSLYTNESFGKKDLRNWVATQTEALAFNDQPKLQSILDSDNDYWIRDSKEIINNLPVLTDISDGRNIILFRDVSIASMPSNLIKTKSGKLLADIAPLHQPSTVEVYLKSEPFSIDMDMVKLWAPVEEGDFAINIAFDKIDSLFDESTLLKITTLNPRVELNKDINIFISHGGKDELYGFKSISPADDKYFLNEKDIFGTGKIAILFICHSGSLKSSLYATKLDGLVNKILDFGYESVLAPAWSYNVILTGVWTRNFINSINQGKSLSESTFFANQSVKSVYPNVGAYAAMHLFGSDGLDSLGK